MTSALSPTGSTAHLACCSFCWLSPVCSSSRRVRATLSDGQNFVFASEDFAGYLPRTLVTPRRGDLLIGQPRHYRHKIVVTNGPIDFIPPDPISLENAAFKFNYGGTAQESSAMEMQWEYDGTAYPVGADQAAAIAADVRKLGENWQFTWDLTPDE